MNKLKGEKVMATKKGTKARASKAVKVEEKAEGNTTGLFDDIGELEGVMSLDVLNNSAATPTDTIDTTHTEQENEELFNRYIEKVESYKLDWNFRAIEYILNKENTSFGQLRSCVYIKNGEAYFDYIKSTILIIKAGLVGSKQYKPTDTEELENRAYEIAEEWRAEFTSLSILHLLLIHILEVKHFFMDTAGVQIIQHLSSRNLQKDICLNILREDLEERTRQAQAIATN